MPSPDFRPPSSAVARPFPESYSGARDDMRDWGGLSTTQGTPPRRAPFLRRHRQTIKWVLLCVLVLAKAVTYLSAQVHYSTARPVEEMARDYPYDVELVSSRGTGTDTTVLTTADLLTPHLGKRPVVLLFWMTTCGPCRLELAELEKLLPEWQAAADFAFVPISLDFPKRRAAFHERAGAYPWTSYLDVHRESPKVLPGGLNGVPQIFVFDETGTQVFYRRKYRAGDLEALGAALLKVKSMESEK